MIRFVFLLFFAAGFSSASPPFPGQDSPPSDNNYYISEQKDYRIIFDHQYLGEIDIINKKIRHYLDSMSRFQNKKLKEPVTIILLSAKNQISNASASLLPFSQINMHPSGVDGLNHMSLNRWFDNVFTHELTHIFQVSETNIWPLSYKIKSPVLILAFLPYPNIMLPSLFLEGDAVLKESILGLGGRLYSGSVRALTFSQIKKYQKYPGKLMSHLINTKPTPHSRKGQYHHGGYLFSALAQKFSHSKVNQFFKSHAQHNTFMFFTFNLALMDTFEMDLEEIMDFYVSHYGKEASKQQSSHSPVLFESSKCTPFNSLKDQVFFLTTDGKTEPYLRIYNKKTKEWRSKKTDLPIGKVFKIEDRYFSRSSETIKKHVVSYSLFSEGVYPLKAFNSKYVQDIKNGHTLYIDTKNNLSGYRLYLNNDFYSFIHSNALFDSSRNIYYFRQEGGRRTLYKNKQPVFSYKGYYGHLTGIEDDGSVFFQASSPYGSSLYQYRDYEITRSSPSDTILQAQILNNEQALVCEIFEEGYRYKIIPIDQIAEHPVLYKYHFDRALKPYKQPVTQHIPQRKPEPPTEQDLFKEELKEDEEFEELELENYPYTDQKQADKNSERTRQLASKTAAEDFLKKPLLKYEKYSPLKNIYFSHWVPLSFRFSSLINLLNPHNIVLHSSMLFTDYLQKNYINLSYTVHSLFYQRFSFDYENRSHPLAWTLGYRFGFLSYDIKPLMRVFPLNRHQPYIGLSFPLFQAGHWSSLLRSTILFTNESLDSSYVWIHKELKSGEVEMTQNTLDWNSTWVLQYIQKYPLALYPNKGLLFGASYKHDYNFDRKKYDLSFDTQLQTLLHLGYEFYIFPKIFFGQALSRNTYSEKIRFYPIWQDISSLRFSDKLFDLLEEIYPFELPSSFALEGSSSFSINLNIAKVINTPIYFSTFPLSLRRIAPSFHVKYTFLKDPRVLLEKKHPPIEKNASFLNIVEPGIGLDMEFLLGYKTPIIFNILRYGLSFPVDLSDHSGFYFSVRSGS